MKSAWDIIAFLAVVNLVGVMAFVGWLAASGRMNKERLETTRALFAEPVDVVAEREAQAELDALAQAESAAIEESLANLPASSGVPIEAAEKAARHQQVILRRLEEENERDRRVLEQYERRLKARELELRDKEAQFIATRKAEEAARQNQQFLETVKLLQDLPPRQGKDFILMRVQDGDIDQTIAWLRAMRPGSRTAIFEAMKSDEELALASDLLERLSGAPKPAQPVVETTDASLANSAAPG